MIDSNNRPDISQIREELRQIIIEAFGGDVPAIPDDVPILDLGIGSLALVEGMRRVYDDFGVLVSIRRVIEGQVTLGGLALYIEQELSTQGSMKKNAQPATPQWTRERKVPLASSQQHLAFLSRYSSEAAAASNEALVVRLTGALDGPALQAAIQEVGVRYEALRTAISPDKDTLIVGAGAQLELVVSPVPGEQLDQRLAEIVARPFETGKRLFRAELLRLSETQHTLALVGHALVLDREALTLVLEDVAELYSLFSRDEEAGPTALAIQWTDYLALDDTPEAREARRRAEAYWEEVYASGLPRLELPGDRPRPPIKKYAGDRLALQLEAGLDKRLRAWAAAQGVRPDVGLFAAFTAFLHRLSDQADLVVGVESEPLYREVGARAVAPTRNMLPLSSKFDPAASFRDHVQAQTQSLAAVNAHRHVSLAEMIQLLRPARDQSRSALFTVGFRAWEQATAPTFEALETAYDVPPGAGARYDLELMAVASESGTLLVCDYSTELFEVDTISRWLRGTLALLEAGLTDPAQSCGMLPIMPAEEQDTLLLEWNKTEKPYPRERTVLDLIWDQARERSAQTAVLFGETSLSYRQLHERVDSLAAALQAQGVKKGDRVGLLLQRSLDLIPSILAVWQVGGLYVPLDAGFPKKRLAFMRADADIRIVITNRGLVGLLDEEPTPTPLFVDEVDRGARYASVGDPRPDLSESAMILFTSGSTGKPKGVEIRHRALLNCLLATKDYLGFDSTSSMLALTTISFDISTNELLMPLISGGCVDLGEDGLVADGIELAERLASRRPSHVQATPSTWKTVLAAGWKGSDDICLMSSGEALSRDLAEQLLGRSRVLWNLYGPTETTVYSSAYRVESAPEEPMRIGRPLPNTQMYILDGQHQPMPVGAVGELYIGGESLAVGYWQRPELTAERFVANPFRPGERMYRTGDLARYLPDRNILCLGRVDDQVKVHGVRVELGEVESALRSLDGVRDAVVVSWSDPRGDTQLVGHVIVEDQAALTAPRLRQSLREHLPEVMIPPYFMFSEAFPLTANGKVHRASLPSPDTNRQASTEAVVEAPATPTEKVLAEAWATVLSIDTSPIGRDSDFMDLGGHSLLMTQLMLEVHKSFQVSFNMREFFGASTLRKFAALIDERRAQPAAKRNGRPAAPRVTQTADWARQRMAFLQREAQLPLYIAPGRGLTFQPREEKRAVFLTGATGFLGTYIVAEILRTTEAHLYCLVRPRRGENSRERIEKQMRHYDVWGGDEQWQSAWDGRMHVVEGDVTLPRMGLPDAVYETLARDVDAILNGAAHVNFIYPYEALRATNVLGLHEIIQFAFHSRIKPVHHLSTAAIWPMGAQGTYYEKDSIEHNGRLNLGYDEAKWVGERCLLYAAERGLPVARYRPGEVGGDSVTGHCVTDHFLIASVKGFLQLGVMPALDIEVDVAPVDYVARAIVYLALRRSPVGHAFHLTNPYSRPISEPLAYLRGLGYQFQELPFEQLRDRLLSSPGFSTNALFAYQAALQEMDNLSLKIPIYDTRETLRELEGSGIACPPADGNLFATYLRYLQGIGFIPQPEELVSRV